MKQEDQNLWQMSFDLEEGEKGRKPICQLSVQLWGKWQCFSSNMMLYKHTAFRPCIFQLISCKGNKLYWV